MRSVFICFRVCTEISNDYREQWIMSGFKDIYGVLQLNALAVNQHQKSQELIASVLPMNWDMPFMDDPHDYFYQEFWSGNSEQALKHNPIAKRQLQ